MIRPLHSFLFFALLALGACSKPAPVVTPALWEVTGPQGQRGWLFGTIHALPHPVNWRSAWVDKALANSDRLVLEIDNANDPAALQKIYGELAGSPGLPPLEARVLPAQRGAFRQIMDKLGLDPASFATTETWAVALSLSRQGQAGAEAEYGMESALMEAAKGKPVAQLEGADAQLRLFDALPEKEQQDLLGAIIVELGSTEDSEKLAKAWSTGDMQALETETRTGLLADPELRDALLVSRNQAWSAKVAALLRSGAHPLVAVGAAHMAGADGLPALLTAQGYAVTRLQ